MGSLDGKVIIVTGASRGIGAAASAALAAAGATVVLTGRPSQNLTDVATAIARTGATISAGRATFRTTRNSLRWPMKWRTSTGGSTA